jgi:hypothetical protein
MPARTLPSRRIGVTRHQLNFFALLRSNRGFVDKHSVNPRNMLIVSRPPCSQSRRSHISSTLKRFGGTISLARRIACWPPSNENCGMSGFTIDFAELDFPCPKCRFSNPFWIRQARLRDVIICRGCKCNIQLDDQMNSVRVAERNVRRAMDDLASSLESMSRQLTIKL